MADIRIKDLTTTASSTASDDFIAVDGTTNGTRKLNAFSPTFGGNATVTGTLTTNGNVTINSNVGTIGKSGTGTGGNWRFVSDDGTTRWLNGLLGGSGETSYSIYDSANSRSLLTATAAGVVQINQTTASTSTSTGALVVGGGLGVGGATNIGGTLTVSGGSVTLTGAAYSIFYADGSSGGNFTIRKAGVAYGTLYGNETNTVLDSAGSANLILQTGGATRVTMDSTRVSIPLTTASTSTSTGALVVSGGVGVAGAIYAGGNTNAFGAGGTGGANSQLILEGGSAANGGGAILYRKNGTVKAYAGMESSILGGGSTSDNYIIYTSSGLALTVAGQQVQANATTASTSTSTGALVVSGGVGVAKDLYVGGTVITLQPGSGTTAPQQKIIGPSGATYGPSLFLDASASTSGKVYIVGSGLSGDNGGLGSFYVYDVSAGTSVLKIVGGNTTLAGNITTAAPAGGTAAAWKLGTVASVSPTSPNRTIEVDIGGTIYYIHAKTTNN